MMGVLAGGGATRNLLRRGARSESAASVVPHVPMQHADIIAAAIV